MGFNYMLIQLIDIIFQVLYYAIIIRVILSWFVKDSYNQVYQFLCQFTDPILRPFQNLIPSYRLGIDLSPILAFLALKIIRQLLISLLI